MMPIQIRDGKINFQKEKIPLLSGEFHYWRIDPIYWNPILDTIEDLGLNFISTYICWEFHQIGNGQFDFTGKTHPRRDLKKFLELTRKRNFKLFIRPGPYIYSEWKNLGIPDRAARHHRMSKKFLIQAEVYMKAVTKVLRPYLATNGGHIVLFQADNEIDPISAGYEQELGLNGGKGPFTTFLKAKYLRIKNLNEKWGSNYDSFHQAKAVTSGDGLNPHLWIRLQDYREFIHSYTTEKAQWMLEKYQKLGMNVPYVFNTYSEFEVQNWRDLESVGDIAGVDLYPENEFSAGPDSQRLYLERIRLLRSYSKAPYIVEFESGLWHGFIERVGSLKPNHYELTTLSALLGGVVGWNWYMLVNRDNWYQAPITELGDWRGDLKPVFKKLVNLYKQFKPSDCTKLCDTSISFSYSHYRCGYGNKPDLVLKSFYEADIDYDFCDLETGKVSNPILFYSGEEWLPRKEQEFLVDTVEKGGTLILFQNGPFYDEHKKPLNLLNLPLPESILGGKEVLSHKKNIQIDLGKGLRPEVCSEIYLYGATKNATSIWGNQVPSSGWELQWKLLDCKRYRVGLILKRGKGKIYLFGVTPNPAIVHAIHDVLKIRKYATSPTEGVQTALFKRKKSQEFILVLTNNTTQQVEASVRLDLQNKVTRWASLMDPSKQGKFVQKGAPLQISLPAKSGDVLKIIS